MFSFLPSPENASQSWPPAARNDRHQRPVPTQPRPFDRVNTKDPLPQRRYPMQPQRLNPSIQTRPGVIFFNNLNPRRWQGRQGQKTVPRHRYRGPILQEMQEVWLSASMKRQYQGYPRVGYRWEQRRCRTGQAWIQEQSLGEEIRR